MTTKIFRVGILQFHPSVNDINGAVLFWYTYRVDVQADSIEQAIVEARKQLSIEAAKDEYMAKHTAKLDFNAAFLISESVN